MGASPEFAGRAVVCPHCTREVTVPVPTLDRAAGGGWTTATTDAGSMVRKREESIFADPHHEAVEGTAAHAAFRDLSQPTRRVPGMTALEEPSRQTPPPRTVPVSQTDSNPFPVALDLYPSPNSDLGAVDPFVLTATRPAGTEAEETDRVAKGVTPRDIRKLPNATPDWKLWILIGLAAYSVIITVVALWGWSRTPKAVMVVPAPTAAKAKPR